MKTLRNMQTKDRIAQAIRDEILSGHMEPGEELAQEALAEMLGVSRMPVREALLLLENAGLVEIQKNKRAIVKAVTPEGVKEHLEIRSILEVRRALEHLAVTRIIRFATDEQIAALGDTLARLAASENPAQAAERAFDFQHELALASGNSILPLFYYSFRSPVLTLWIRFCRRYGIESLCRNTELLYTHLKNRNEAAAAAWIDQYLGKAISGSQQVYGE